ncbi:glycosyltransferase [Actinotalea fermentans]|uniref:Putative dTDP-rhamnosyltransferase n=1 Tax=Actinotalea fermentans TaxID=43671 RepID=A0A511YSY9_9CELL|nr:glycosyltransferase [Actinotalea fermentans]KGM16998.1 N-acetylglucosaminyl-diphospho-decaprenol L-rhamnosyltransferase [Actinotalea fermentans ATCC 43279 = JCM 9966 = DSM 3133]GEN78286.1 putative dTDP-rhamnosyltransferase [Actinotalea fermentans]
MTSDRPAVRVVCVAYHPGVEELTAFATSLRTATTADVELVVVDNGADQSVAAQVAREQGARLVVPGRNLGYGAAANLGTRGATQPWLVVANQDIVWHEGALDALLQAAADSGAGSAGPTLLNTDGTRYPSARALPSLRLGVGHALLVRVWPGNPWTRRYQEGADEAEAVRDGEPRAAGWLSGACLLLRRDAFEALGGFDEGYFMFFEDVDLGERLGRAGWLNLHVPAARVTHVQGTSWKSRPAPMIRAHHASARRYLARRYARWYQLPLRVALGLGLRLRERLELRRASS